MVLQTFFRLVICDISLINWVGEQCGFVLLLCLISGLIWAHHCLLDGLEVYFNLLEGSCTWYQFISSGLWTGGEFTFRSCIAFFPLTRTGESYWTVQLYKTAQFNIFPAPAFEGFIYGKSSVLKQGNTTGP